MWNVIDKQTKRNYLNLSVSVISVKFCDPNIFKRVLDGYEIKNYWTPTQKIKNSLKRQFKLRFIFKLPQWTTFETIAFS